MTITMAKNAVHSEPLITGARFGFVFEPVREKINYLGFRPGPTQTYLYGHRSRLEP